MQELDSGWHKVVPFPLSLYCLLHGEFLRKAVVRHLCHIPEIVQDYLVRFSCSVLGAVCERIENSDRTRTGPDWGHFGQNRTGT